MFLSVLWKTQPSEIHLATQATSANWHSNSARKASSLPRWLMDEHEKQPAFPHCVTIQSNLGQCGWLASICRDHFPLLLCESAFFFCLPRCYPSAQWWALQTGGPTAPSHQNSCLSENKPSASYGTAGLVVHVLQMERLLIRKRLLWHWSFSSNTYTIIGLVSLLQCTLGQINLDTSHISTSLQRPVRLQHSGSDILF